MNMVLNPGNTDTIWALKQHLIKWDNISQSGKFYNREVYRLLRSKKPGAVQKETMTQVFKGRLECTKADTGTVALAKVGE